MGQRHQVYAFTNQGNFTWHCQWSYGTLPLHALKRILIYNQETDKYGKLSQKKESTIDLKAALHMLLSCDYMNGHIGRYSDESNNLIDPKGIAHPEWGDNNDGITILDLRGNIPKYCFMLIDEKFATGRRKRLYKKPLTPNMYVRDYYTKNPQRRAAYETEEDSANWDSLGINDLLETLRQAEGRVLSLDECARLMPDFMEDILERATIKKAPRNELPLYVNTKFPVNKRLVEKRLKEAA